jgi:ketosteroid isomerase-like protein
VTTPLALVEDSVARFNAGDYAAFTEIFSPDVVMFTDPQIADRSEYHGRAGVQEWITESLNKWAGVRFRALAVEQIAEEIFVELAVVGDTEGGGGAWRVYVVLSWSDGKVSCVRAHPDRAAALADAGRT